MLRRYRPFWRDLSRHDKYPTKSEVFINLPLLAPPTRDPWPAIHDVGSVSRKLMKGKRRNQTNDAVWNLFGDLCKSNLSGDIHVGELMEPPGNRDKCSLIRKSLKGPSMDSMGKGFMRANELPSLPNISYGHFFGRFHG